MTTAGSLVVAERYARALLAVVQDKKVEADRVADELQDVAAFLESQAKLGDVLSTPTIPAERRVAVLDELLSKEKLAPCTLNLLRLLAVRERVPLLDLIVTQYRRLVLELREVQPGTVTSVTPLSEQQRNRLATSLGTALGKTMELSYRTDPELVGGLVVRIGNRVFDASVVTQLQRFKEKALASL